MADAYIYDHVRTPRGRGKKNGSLHEVPAVRLSAKTLEAIRDRNEIADTAMIDDVILGCVDPVGEAGSDIARAAVFEAGYDNKVPGMQINRFCASGLDAINMAKRSEASWKDGRFKNSVVPIKDQNGLVILDHDEHMRPETNMQSLASLDASFVMMGEMGGFDAVGIAAHPELEAVNHVHHAGNSSGIVDGAAAVLMGSEEGGKKLGIKPRAKIRAFANIGSDPALMLTGPVDVTEKLLARANMKLSDIDLFELNEAFASVVLRYMQHFDISHDKMNVCGGAIAMGHPLGATGAMILGTVLDELERRDQNTALVTLCIGAGMGTATIIERV